MPYTYLKTCPGIRTSLMCMPYMYALCVCLIRMRYMYSLRALFCFFFCFFSVRIPDAGVTGVPVSGTDFLSAAASSKACTIC